MRSLIALGAVTSVAAACSAGTTDHSSAPTSVEYDVEFPSTAAAVAADTIQTFVYSSSTPKTDCPSLLVARQSGSGLPTAVAQAAPVALCDMAAGGKGQISGVGYGNVSFLVVAQRGGADYMTGCTLTTLSASVTSVSVQLGLVNDQPIPLTSCQTVSDFCASPSACTVGGDGG